MSDDYSSDKSEEIRDKKKQEGFIVVEPKANELLLDIDSKERLKYCFETIKELQSISRIFIKIEIRHSKSDNFHIRITTYNNIHDEVERILMQALLGSDPNREFATLLNHRCDKVHPNMLFTTGHNWKDITDEILKE